MDNILETENPENQSLIQEDTEIIFSDDLLQNYGEDLFELIPNSPSNQVQDNQSIILCIAEELETQISDVNSTPKDLCESVLNTVKENEDLFEFTAKLKKASQEAYQKRLKTEAEKKEKKRERDREYQRKRYQKLKNKANNTESSYQSCDSRPSTKKAKTYDKRKIIQVKTVQVIDKTDCDSSNDNVTPLVSRPSSNTPKTCNKIINVNNVQLTNKTDRASPKENVTSSSKSVNTDARNNIHLDKLEMIRFKARERQRKRRSLMTEEQLKLKRAKNRDYMARKKEENQEHPKEVTEREKRRLAKLNRARVKKCREKKKREKMADSEKYGNTVNESSTLNNITKNSKNPTSNHKKQGPRFSKNQPQTINKKLETELESMKRKLKTVNQRCERYKKRFQRLVNSDNSPSPSKKIRKLAGGKKLPTPVKRRLKFFETLESGLISKRNEIKKRGNQRELNDFNTIICSPKLKKRKIVNQATSLFTYKGYKKACGNIERKPSARRLSSITVHLVKKFYQQDNVSKMLPGKRDFKSNNKIKKQKRLLMGTYKDLLKKFNKEHPTNKIKSVDTFRRLKPFWVVASKLGDRNTCACIICSNVQLMLDKGNILKVTTLKLEELVENSVCKTNSKSCMLNKCQRCDGKLKDTIEVINENQVDEVVTYFQWLKSDKTIPNGKTIKVVIKTAQTCSKKDFLERFYKKMLIYREHLFKIKHQFSELTALKENLKEKEALVHIDFSENYCCKGHAEPQSMHFGGSKNQLSLHTVLIYKKDFVKSLCTVSTNTDHRAYAVWAHLRPIFDQLTDIETLHLQSDGPSSQYKNRYNMYFITKVKDYLPNLKHLTWNFSISGHGKGASDGVGGTVKRSADLRVKNGRDIFDIETFINEVKEATDKIEIIQVKSDEIASEKKKLESLTLEAIPSCIKVHQVTWSANSANLIHLRELSCFSCKYDNSCEHHRLHKETHSFKNGETHKTSKAKFKNLHQERVLASSSSSDLGDKVASGSKSTAGEPQQEMTSDFSDPKENDWLLVKFKGKKTNHYYVCVVENVTNDGIQVHCARNMGNTTFKWAEPNDKCVIDYDQIEKKLPSPIFKYKNDRMVSFKFSVDFPYSIAIN